MALSLNLRGAVFMSVSMAGFTANDAITKVVSSSMNMGQVMLLRGLFASALILALAWHRGALIPVRTVASPFVFLRVVGEVCATVFFLVALANMPLANISAVLQALPLAVTMGAALVYGEPVGWRRWLAIAAGFAGVLIIVRPGFEGFNAYSISALICVFFCTVRDLSTKRVPREIPSLFLSSATAIAVTIMGGVLVVPFGGWSPVAATDLALLAAAAVLLLFGYQFIILAMRDGEISFIAPFRYTALLWAIGLGVVVFGELPDAAMIAGATVIVASGLYALYRERVRGESRPAAKATAPTMQPDGL
ncbi:MAG: DMT family transporter [Rhizobiaceae bacterium]|nr:DMT family transporter [Rhizobiaceae bacterium]MCV0407058.1 DMT family transporter [Rhizobiaceae bacterium]